MAGPVVGAGVWPQRCDARWSRTLSGARGADNYVKVVPCVELLQPSFIHLKPLQRWVPKNLLTSVPDAKSELHPKLP